MTTRPDPDLRSTLHRLADSTTPLPVDDGLWQRGQASRRRARAFGIAAVLALIVSVGGVATLLTTTDRAARTASGEVVEGGAIPSQIEDPGGLEVETDLAVGRASVAFVTDGQAVVVTATDGRYHALGLPGRSGELLSLSPDGTSLVWAFTKDSEDSLLRMGGLEVLDLVSGETSLRLTSNADGTALIPRQVSWSPSGQWLTWFGGDAVGRMPVGEAHLETAATGKQVEWSAVDDDGVVTLYAQGPRQWQREGHVGRMRMSEDTTFDAARSGRNDFAVASPTGRTFALASTAEAAAVDFVDAGRFEDRSLAADLYPDGAAVRPLGWVTDSLVLAQVDAPDGSYVEGRHLALLTSPDRPESEWTYRILVRDVPTTPSLSVAVDLIPDLDGTSSQQLTHDFASPTDRRDISWMIGLGVAAAIAIVMGLRRLWRRFT